MAPLPEMRAVGMSQKPRFINWIKTIGKQRKETECRKDFNLNLKLIAVWA